MLKYPDMEGSKFIAKYLFLGVLVLSAILAFLILFPFSKIIILGIAFSVVLYPLYEWIKKILGGKFNLLPVIITVFLFLIILCAPFLFLGSIIFNQVQDLYNSFDISNGGHILESISSYVKNILPYGFVFDIQKELSIFISSLSSNLTNVFSATLNTFFMFVLSIITMFYFIRDGHVLKKAFIRMMPFENRHTEKILLSMTNTINIVMKGYLFIAIVQGFLMGIGLYIFGIPNSALWGTVAGFLSLIPFFGTSIVSLPAVLYLFIFGTNGNAIGLLIWALVLVGTIDNFLNPLIIGKKTELPPLLVLFSVLGGISIMGPIGILIGPLAMNLFRTLVLIYREEPQNV